MTKPLTPAQKAAPSPFEGAIGNRFKYFGARAVMRGKIVTVVGRNYDAHTVIVELNGMRHEIQENLFFNLCKAVVSNKAVE